MHPRRSVNGRTILYSLLSRHTPPTYITNQRYSPYPQPLIALSVQMTHVILGQQEDEMWRYRIGMFFRSLPGKIAAAWNWGLDLLGEPVMALVVFFLIPMTVAFVYVVVKHGLWAMVWVVFAWGIVFLVGFVRSCIKYAEKVEAAKRKVANFDEEEDTDNTAMPGWLKQAIQQRAQLQQQLGQQQQPPHPYYQGSTIHGPPFPTWTPPGPPTRMKRGPGK